MNTNETKHTPGPWKLSTDLYHIQAGGIAVAAIFGSSPYNYERDRSEAMANAALIAAAPDMLEALKEAIDLLESYLTDADREASPCGRWPKLRAAIAKAEGRG